MGKAFCCDGNEWTEKYFMSTKVLDCMSVCAYRMCAKNSNDLGQSHVPQFICEHSGDEPLRCMEDVVLHNKEPNRKTNPE